MSPKKMIFWVSRVKKEVKWDKFGFGEIIRAFWPIRSHRCPHRSLFWAVEQQQCSALCTRLHSLVAFPGLHQDLARMFRGESI